MQPPPSTRESWVAIDFETANLHGASVWEVGMVAVSAQWAPIATFHRLIRPRPPYDGQRRWDPVYAPMPPEAREADEFDVVLKEMLDFIDKFPDLSETPAQFQERCAQIALRCFWREAGHVEPLPAEAASDGAFSAVFRRLMSQESNGQK